MSKKQSDASLPSPPEHLVFFVDRSLGRRIVPDLLRQVGEDVRVHDDHFPQNAEDRVWLAEAGKQGWIVLTKDARIRYRAIESAALRAAGVRAFVLTARGDLSGREMAEIFIKALAPIKALCMKAAPPFIARVSREGHVTLIK